MVKFSDLLVFGVLLAIFSLLSKYVYHEIDGIIFTISGVSGIILGVIGIVGMLTIDDVFEKGSQNNDKVSLN